MRFLFRRESGPPARRVLVVQTCNPNLLDHVTRDVLAGRDPREVTVLLQRNMRPWIVFHEGVTYLDNPTAGRREMLRRLRAEGYDGVVTTLSGEPGYWKLKLLPFLLSPREVIVYNRHARPFPLDLVHVGRYLAEVGRGVAGMANPEGLTLRWATRKLAAPFLFAYLLLFLRRRRLAGPKER